MMRLPVYRSLSFSFSIGLFFSQTKLMSVARYRLAIFHRSFIWFKRTKLPCSRVNALKSQHSFCFEAETNRSKQENERMSQIKKMARAKTIIDKVYNLYLRAIPHNEY